jgi:hypothetical protein
MCGCLSLLSHQAMALAEGSGKAAFGDFSAFGRRLPQRSTFFTVPLHFLLQIVPAQNRPYR